MEIWVMPTAAWWCIDATFYELLRVDGFTQAGGRIKGDRLAEVLGK
jgi:hypothetical protein